MVMVMEKVKLNLVQTIGIEYIDLGFRLSIV